MKPLSPALRLLLVSAALTLPASLVACGDDDGGGGGGGTTQVFDSTQPDKDKMLSELSQEEVTALCEEYQEYVASEISEAELKRFACYAVAAAFSGGDANACNMLAQQCIEAPDENNGGLEPDDGSDDCDADELKDCEATIGELEACFSATIDQLNSAAQNASCSTSSLDDVGSPAACAPLMEKCPELFEDDGNNGFNNGTNDTDATLSIDGASVTVVDTSFSSGGGNGTVSLTLADGSLTFTWSVPALPAEVNMAEAMETENASVTLIQGDTTWTNTTSDTTPGTLTVMESPSGFGIVLQFTGTVVDGDGNEKTLDATYE